MTLHLSEDTIDTQYVIKDVIEENERNIQLFLVEDAKANAPLPCMHLDYEATICSPASAPTSATSDTFMTWDLGSQTGTVIQSL